MAGVQGRIRVLKNHLNATAKIPRPIINPDLGEFDRTQLHRSARCRLQTGDDARQGRLAAPRFPDDGERLSFRRHDTGIGERAHASLVPAKNTADLVRLRQMREPQRRTAILAHDHIRRSARPRFGCRNRAEAQTPRLVPVIDQWQHRHRARRADLANRERATRRKAAPGPLTIFGHQSPVDRRQPRRLPPIPQPRQCRQQPARIRMRRHSKDGLNTARFHQTTRIENADPIAQSRDCPEIMADEQDCGAKLASELAHEIQNRRLDCHVEPRRRLIHDQQLRLCHQRHRNDDPLLLPAR